MRTHKRKKRTRLRGSKTAFYGARKKHKGKGHRGGKGMAGTGKRADQKKTLILKLYGNKYFGKKGVTSRGSAKNKDNKINLGILSATIDNFVKRGIAKKSGDTYTLNLEDYIILGDGDLNQKLIIHASKASKSAIEKVKKAGGEIILK